MTRTDARDQDTQAPLPLIIDTDVALGIWHDGRPRDIDDGFAIAEALNSPQLDLQLVSTVYGNAPLDSVVQVAREIIALKGSNVPVLRGADSPMVSRNGTSAVTNAAVEGMAECLRSRRCAVAAIGPLTNMALLARFHPDAFANISHLVIVAGRTPNRRFFLGDKGPVQDFNFENDVASTELMLASVSPDTQVVLAGFELTSQVCITEQDLETIAKRANPVALYFHKQSLDWCRYWTTTFPSDTGFHPWDSAAISWFKHPEYFASESRGWRVTHRPRGSSWLECDTSFAGGRVDYLTGFTPGGAAAFIKDVVSSVY